MSISVLITPQEGRFSAAVLGSQTVRAEGDTEMAAINALKAQLDQLQLEGRIMTIELDSAPLGLRQREYTEEEKAILEEIVTEAYRLRDEQKAQEFPE